jgi:hypothetical protein
MEDHIINTKELKKKKIMINQTGKETKEKIPEK